MKKHGKMRNFAFTKTPFLMPIIEVNDINDSRLGVYTSLTEAQLRNRLEPEKGIFIVESPKVIRVALDAGCEPLSLLCERRP